MNQRSVAKRPDAVMVVGGAGFLGSHIVDRLLAENSRVDVVDDLSSGSLANLATARSSSAEGALRIHTLDVTIPEFVDVVLITDVGLDSGPVTVMDSKNTGTIKEMVIFTFNN